MLEEASEEEAIVRGLGFGFVGAYTLAGKRAIEMMSGQDQPTTLWEKRRGKANEYEEEEEHDEREASHLISSHLISSPFSHGYGYGYDCVCDCSLSAEQSSRIGGEAI